MGRHQAQHRAWPRFRTLKCLLPGGSNTQHFSGTNPSEGGELLADPTDAAYEYISRAVLQAQLLTCCYIQRTSRRFPGTVLGFSFQNQGAFHCKGHFPTMSGSKMPRTVSCRHCKWRMTIRSMEVVLLPATSGKIAG